MKIDKTALAIAQTHHFTLGSPRTIQLSPDGGNVYFCRSESSTSNVHALWKLDRRTNTETILFNPLNIHDLEEHTAEEEKQRERLRETSFGVTQYQLSEDGSYICFSYYGQLWIIETKTDKATPIKAAVHVFDPRFSPDASHIAYVTVEGLHVTEAKKEAIPRLVLQNESNDIYWGQAEFAASEEFERYRGFWWSPDSKQLLVSHVNETAVAALHGVSDDPFEEPGTFRYPVAGTDNAAVTLYVIDREGGNQAEITWDNQTYPYLLNAQWKDAGLFITLQTRDQKKVVLYNVAADMSFVERLVQTDRRWVDVLQPLPYIDKSGSIISTTGTTFRRIAVNGKAVTPKDLHVEDFIGIFENHLIYTASPNPKERVVYATNIDTKATIALTPHEGLFLGSVYAEGIYITGRTMNDANRMHLWIPKIGHKAERFKIVSHTAKSPLVCNPIYAQVGADKLETCLLMPEGGSGNAKLPVILQVYGGPHHQEVTYNKAALQEAAWFTSKGYAVLMIDGPGTPGRSLNWERLIYHDLITPIAEAQISALKEILILHPELDKTRIATRGWSFGGYLSAFLPVLYPGLIRAAIVGAPVTDWRLYDTHYTERYLGNPAKNKKAYEKSSLLKAATTAKRPMLIIHGFSDDNVVIAHSLQLLKSLTKAHSPYTFLPLVGASHFSKQAEQNALLLQMELDFLRKELR